MVLKIILCILFGYLVGNINPSYIIGRLRGFDIRKKGSGNAGASNAVITMGKGVGVASAVFDILKATAVYLLAPLMFGDLALAAELAGAACIIGHIFPVVMKFRGGKGLACLGGVMLGMDWRFFLIALAAEICLVLLVDYICIAPITASILTPLCYVWFGADYLDWLMFAENGWIGAAVLGVASLVILSRHVQNIRRIVTGTEMHFSYLWSKDKEAELDRVRRNTEIAEAKKKKQ